MGKIRIIGGIHRSRQIEVLDEDGLRPTLDRVKETLFNWLGQDLTGLTCLDLFTGSGSLAFEALSRNAREVIMLEQNTAVFKQLKQKKKLLKLENCIIYNQDALVYLKNLTSRKFDIIFIDPPYESDLLEQVLPLIRTFLTETSVIYVEYKNKVNFTGFEVIKQKKAGVVNFVLLKGI